MSELRNGPELLVVVKALSPSKVEPAANFKKPLEVLATLQDCPTASGHGRSNRLHLSNNILNLAIHTSQVVHDIRRRACSVVVAGPEAAKQTWWN
jgi:hypothetical protein